VFVRWRRSNEKDSEGNAVGFIICRGCMKTQEGQRENTTNKQTSKRKRRKQRGNNKMEPRIRKGPNRGVSANKAGLPFCPLPYSKSMSAVHL
jgi:hypothetical protein